MGFECVRETSEELRSSLTNKVTVVIVYNVVTVTVDNFIISRFCIVDFGNLCFVTLPYTSKAFGVDYIDGLTDKIVAYTFQVII